MIDLPAQPRRATIRAVRGECEVRLRWREARRAVTCFCLASGAAAAVAAGAFITWALVAKRGEEILPMLVIGPVVVFFLLATVLAWFMYRGVVTLVLGMDVLTLIGAAEKRFPMLPPGVPVDPSDPDRMEWLELRHAMRERFKRTVPRADISDIATHGRPGGAFVYVESAGRKLIVGGPFVQEEADWLAEVIHRWARAGPGA